MWTNSRIGSRPDRFHRVGLGRSGAGPRTIARREHCESDQSNCRANLSVVPRVIDLTTGDLLDLGTQGEVRRDLFVMRQMIRSLQD